LLRSVGIIVQLHEGEYSLDDTIARAVALLPFPDPHLSFGEITQLLRGRSAIHRRLREQMNQLIS
jgi:hypothetical protein